MPIPWETIEPLLMQVEKPARYVGGEFNQIVKDDATITARACLAFPDIYDIGMSYHGFRILYERINARAGWAAERAFAPWPDFEARLRRERVPLYSLETRRPLSAFDWIGFTLQHEANLTNVLTMIDLAGLPLESAERDEWGDRPDPFPILIGGGEGAYSPEPLAPFLDAFAIGAGEELALELMAFFARARAGVAREGWDRARVLRELGRIDGIYVPRFWQPEYKADGTIAAVRRIGDWARAGTRSGERDAAGAKEGVGAPPVIHKRHFNIAADLGAVAPVVPLMKTVHDRLVIEIRRGCVSGCRFCQAGMINRPIGERPLEQIIEIARRGLAATGYDGLSLLSLSSSDYTLIAPLLRRLNEEFGARGVSVSLPSLRINGFDIHLVDDLVKGKKSNFTFAPEAGTERLRNVINKPVDQAAFFEIIEDVFRRGWRTVKFYFMIGLPTETDEDLEGIVEICARAAELGRRHHGRKATVNVTLSPFVPKANTPFQWEAQMPREELERRFRHVRGRLRERAILRETISVKAADPGASFLEAVLARGDRRLGRAVRRAWELGARFDGWDEHFRLETWLRAFAETGIDPAFYANRERGEDEIFPYEHISSDAGRRFLLAERRRAWQGRATGRCDLGTSDPAKTTRRTDACAGCDVCGETIGHTLARDLVEGDTPPDAAQPSPIVRDDSAATEPCLPPAVAGRLPEGFTPPAGARRPRFGEAANKSAAPVARLRLAMTKLGALRYLSHLDFARVLMMILRRAGVPLACSQGFSPVPRIQFAPPLSLGMGGEREAIDMFLTEPVEPVGLLKRLAAIHLDGLTWLGAEPVPVRAASLEASIRASIYRVELAGEYRAVSEDELRDALAAFAARESYIIEVVKKETARPVDLKQSILAARLTDPVAAGIAASAFSAAGTRNTAAPAMTLTLAHEPGRFVKPHEAAGHLLALARPAPAAPLALGRDARVTRTGFVFH